MELIDKTKAGLRRVGRNFGAVAAACGIAFPQRERERKQEKLRIEKSTIVVVRSSGDLRRKEGVGDLRERLKASSEDTVGQSGLNSPLAGEEAQRLLEQFRGVPLPSEDDVERLQRRSISTPTSRPSTQDRIKSSGPSSSARVVEVGENSEQDHATPVLQAGNVVGSRRRPTVSRLPQSLEQERRRGLVIDVATPVPADPEDPDTAVSPTNISHAFKTPPETPAPWQQHHQAEDPRPFIDLSSHRNTFASSTTYVEAQERWDSYIETLADDDEAKRCSLHAVVSTDIARLVAELDVLHNRIAMANMRAEYRRRSTLDAVRPESWDQPVRHTCSCGRRFELRAESDEERRAKRRTWHAGSGAVTVGRRRGRSGSPESETKRDVMVRHSAGTTLFRHSLHGMPETGDCGAESRGLAERRGVVLPRLELSKSFGFRRECERRARRIRPTLPGWKA